VAHFKIEQYRSAGAFFYDVVGLAINILLRWSYVLPSKMFQLTELKSQRDVMFIENKNLALIGTPSGWHILRLNNIAPLELFLANLINLL
jgi:hypothetical protein